MSFYPTHRVYQKKKKFFILLWIVKNLPLFMKIIFFQIVKNYTCSSEDFVKIWCKNSALFRGISKTTVYTYTFKSSPQKRKKQITTTFGKNHQTDFIHCNVTAIAAGEGDTWHETQYTNCEWDSSNNFLFVVTPIFSKSAHLLPVKVKISTIRNLHVLLLLLLSKNRNNSIKFQITNLFLLSKWI